MEICSQDGNDHLYCNDCHRGSYYWETTARLTVLLKTKNSVKADCSIEKDQILSLTSQGQ